MTRVEPHAPAKSQPSFHLPVPKFTIKRFIRLIIIVAVFWVCILISKTGLVNVPVFSGIFYKTPSPRVLDSGEIFGDAQQRVKEMVNGSLSLSNGELSDLTRIGANRLKLGISNVQVVGGTDVPLELSFIIPNRNNALVRIDLVPEVKNNDLKFNVTRTRVGEVDMPNWIIGEPTRLLLASQLQPVLRLAPPLQSISVTKSGLTLGFAKV